MHVYKLPIVCTVLCEVLGTPGGERTGYRPCEVYMLVKDKP